MESKTASTPLPGDSAALFAHVLACARVPEHSPAFMQAMSGGTFFMLGEYCFLAADNWLMALGYPLRGEYAPADFEAALNDALHRTQATDCWCIAPELPARLKQHEADADQFFVVPADAAIPKRLRRPLERARAYLRVDLGSHFGPEHRRLWAEFTARTPLKPNALELFARTEAVMPTEGLALLNAWTNDDRLAACLLLDFAPHAFVSYIIGARSRSVSAPYASDLLIAELLRQAKIRGKEYIHLGLGVNDGIRRFKRKWGGIPALPYRMAAWQEQPHRADRKTDLGSLLLARAAHDVATFSDHHLPPAVPIERPFAMLWQVEKNGRRAWIGGTAHFFRYSFARSFRRLFKQVDTILLEGALDEHSLDLVKRAGHSPGPEVARVIDLLNETEIRRLERIVRGPEGFWPRMLNMQMPNPPDVRFYLAHTHPWCALFSLWTVFLERHGWNQSVDLEIWRIGHRMEKRVVAMETLDEQLASLESVSAERVANFCRDADQWKRYSRRTMRAYLAGDLIGMMGAGAEFPTRTERVIDQRDQELRERMRPYLEAGRCAVFVGVAHLFNLRHMLAEDGFTLRQLQPTWRHRLRAWRRQRQGGAHP